MKSYLAIDIGASSGRHILGRLENGRLVLKEIYRFDNSQVHRNGHDCWDLDALRENIVNGIKACNEVGIIPESVGIDTWGVDFVLLDKNDCVIGDAVAYRDSRTVGMDSLVEQKVNAQLLYSRTGIQKAAFNTVYQLEALLNEHPEQLQKAEWLLTVPDYLNFLLTGVKSNEYTIASTTNLVNAKSMQWDYDIINKLGLPEHIFHPLSMSTTVLGNLTDELAAEVGFNTKVVLPACHDTGCAFLAVPAKDDSSVYISSGTWSLLGVENSEPITTEQSRMLNFTNEGGAFGRYRYLKNIMGLWMVQSVRRELNGVAYIKGKEQRTVSQRQYSYTDLIEEAKKAEGFSSIVDVNNDCFLSPESMIEAIKEECTRTCQTVPNTVGEIMQCVYNSLAVCYKQAVSQLQQLTGKSYTGINIVGGGCQDSYLNQITAKATGLSVYAGPVEATAIGNLVLQMIAAQDLEDITHARNIVINTFVS